MQRLRNLPTIYLIAAEEYREWVCVVYWRRRSRVSSHYFILSLAVLDLVTCVVGMPTEIADLVLPYTFESPIACKVLRFLHSSTVIASSTILIEVAFDRYYRICQLGRQFTPNKARLLCAGALVLGILFAWPSCVLFGRKTVDIDVGGYILHGTDCSTSDSMRDTIFPMIYYLFQFSLFGMTLGFFSVLYGKIGLRIIGQNKVRAGSGSGSYQRHSTSSRKSLFKLANEKPAETSNSELSSELEDHHQHAKNSESGDRLTTPSVSSDSSYPPPPPSRSRARHPIGSISSANESDDVFEEEEEEEEEKAQERSSTKTTLLNISANKWINGINTMSIFPQNRNQKPRRRSSRTLSKLLHRSNSRCNSKENDEHHHATDGKPVGAVNFGSLITEVVNELNTVFANSRKSSLRGFNGLNSVHSCSKEDGQQCCKCKERCQQHLNVSLAAELVHKEEFEEIDLKEEGTGTSLTFINNNSNIKNGVAHDNKCSDNYNNMESTENNNNCDENQNKSVPTDNNTSTSTSVNRNSIEPTTCIPCCHPTVITIPTTNMEVQINVNDSETNDTHEKTPECNGTISFSERRTSTSNTHTSNTAKARAFGQRNCQISKSKSPDSKHTMGHRHHHHHQRACNRQLRVGRTTTVLFAVTLAYILSFLPFLTVMIMRSFVKGLEESLSPMGELAYKLCVKSFFINNAINPIIYSFLNQAFRKDAIDAFKRLCRRP